MFRLGRRLIANNAERWRRERGVGGGGGGSFLSTGALESLLDEEDVKRAGWEDWRGDTVQQVGGRVGVLSVSMSMSVGVGVGVRFGCVQ